MKGQFNRRPFFQLYKIPPLSKSQCTTSPPQPFNLNDAGVQHERPEVFNRSDIFIS
jgi:hypothetical protein